jgi:hypothetical protein
MSSTKRTRSQNFVTHIYFSVITIVPHTHIDKFGIQNDLNLNDPKTNWRHVIVLNMLVQHFRTTFVYWK